jgi:hypothetical protein
LQVSDDPDGKVLATLSTRSADGLAPPDIDPFVLIGMAQIGVAIGKGVGKYLARRAVDAGRIAATSFRQAMAKVEKNYLHAVPQGKRLPSEFLPRNSCRGTVKLMQFR